MWGGMESARPKILIIDDDAAVCEMLTYALEEDGFDVMSVRNGLEAVRLANAYKFDVAVADFKMPGMNGAETVAALRKIDPHLQVIVATGYATRANIIDCMKNGAFDVVEKPYDFSDIRQLLDAAMTRWQLDTLGMLYEGTKALSGVVSRQDFFRCATQATAKAISSSAACLVLQQGKHVCVHKIAAGAVPSDAFLRDLASRKRSPTGPTILPDGSSTHVFEAPFSGALVCSVPSGAYSSSSLILLRDASLPAFSWHEAQAAFVFSAQISLVLKGWDLDGFEPAISACVGHWRENVADPLPDLTSARRLSRYPEPKQ